MTVDEAMILRDRVSIMRLAESQLLNSLSDDDDTLVEKAEIYVKAKRDLNEVVEEAIV